METKDTATIFPYKMTDEDTANLIKLRASNEALFTGKRNASKIAWRAVIREMGLQGKVTSGQASKKWENLKKKYKELKFPPGGLGAGGDVTAASWHWFYLMNEAMEGRLSASAPVLTTMSYGEDEPDSPGVAAARPHSRKRRKEVEKNEILEFLTSEAGRDEGLALEVKEAEAMGMYKTDAYADGDEAESERAAMEAERERAGLEAERVGLHIQRAGFERELAAIDRDRAALEREKAGVERDRAAVERDRALLEKDRASMERERAALDRDWALLEKERASLERQRALLQRDREALRSGTFPVKDDSPAEPDADSLERRERFLCLFEKLIEKL
ncbi:microtubule-associated protein 1A-like isoform X1 [Conger conger]|uniref:microtubule-associated protein 1A-like isoform X1 n=1 Tax=Conger conger TaxID=82655 RepID=UPI002A5AB253|nr:microtubule-associated protein 1A-like isoform X1 [Conger conger]